MAAKSVASNISEKGRCLPSASSQRASNEGNKDNEGKTVRSGKELPYEAIHLVLNLSLLSTCYGHKDLHASNTVTRKLFQHGLKLFIFIVRK